VGVGLCYAVGVDAERVRRVIAEHIRAENEGGLEATLATLSETCVFDSVPRGRTFHGRARARQLYAATFRAFPDWHVELVDLTPGEEYAWAEAVVTATHRGEYEGIPPTGRRVSWRMAVKFTVHGDKLGGETLYFDRLSLIEQLKGGE
jgi:steroid delta-isomerase-like uncharacterized protein